MDKDEAIDEASDKDEANDEAGAPEKSDGALLVRVRVGGGDELLVCVGVGGGDGLLVRVRIGGCVNGCGDGVMMVGCLRRWMGALMVGG